MNKYIVGLIIAGFSLTSSAFAAQGDRPSLSNVTDKRPSLSNIKKMPQPNKPGDNQTSTGGMIRPYTGSVLSGTKATGSKGTVYSTASGAWQEDPVLGRQNAEDVKAFREENGFITRYLKKPATASDKKAMGASIESAVKTLLMTQKNMVKTYEAAAKTTTLMTQDAWNTQAEAAVNAYKASVKSYIDSAKLTEFDKFITGRTNLLKGLFEKLETVRKVKASK